MVINLNRVTENYTWKFLKPCLKSFGGDFVNRFNKLKNICAGVHDTLLDGSDYACKNSLYLLFDKDFHSEDFYSFLDWIKLKDYYIGDYHFSVKLTGKLHMLVLEIPKEYEESYKAFLRGAYSQMYTPEQRVFLFTAKDPIINAKLNDSRDILHKSPKAKLDYIAQLNREFNVNFTIDDFQKDWECALPPIAMEEVFHYPDDGPKYLSTATKEGVIIYEYK